MPRGDDLADTMTIREDFAKAALGNMLANPQLTRVAIETARKTQIPIDELVGEWAKAYTDALLAELEKGEGDERV